MKEFRMICLGLCMFLTTIMQGQNVSTSVIGNSGSSQAKSDIKLQWTLGEIAISQYSSDADISLDEGLHSFVGANIPASYVNDFEQLETMKLYPNPTSGISYFPEIETKGKIESLAILDMTGKLLQSIEQPKGSINLSSFIPGTYIIVVKMGKKLGYIAKLVKI